MREMPDALICDFAETYGIFDVYRLPARLLAKLAAGLRPDSRVMMQLSGASATRQEMLLAAAADRLGLLIWMQTKNGAKPPSILQALMPHEQTQENIVGFDDAESFEKERQRILGRGDCEE